MENQEPSIRKSVEESSEAECGYKAEWTGVYRRGSKVEVFLRNEWDRHDDPWYFLSYFVLPLPKYSILLHASETRPLRYSILLKHHASVQCIFPL